MRLRRAGADLARRPAPLSATRSRPPRAGDDPLAFRTKRGGAKDRALNAGKIESARGDFGLDGIEAGAGEC